MKRYLLLLSFCIILGCAVVSCKKEQELNPCGMLVEWGPGEANVLFPDGCRADEYSITYDGEPIAFDGCDAILYTKNSEHSQPYSVDLEFKISDNAVDMLDVILYDAWVSVSGPQGQGYVETFVYFRGGFWASLSAHFGDDYVPPTIPELHYNGVEYPVSSFRIAGAWHNNREWRCKYGSLDWKEITKNLEYTDCNIIIELEVDGKPLTLNITHISPL